MYKTPALKWFVVSDIHSFFNELIEALNEAGYDKSNKHHRLIIVGDIFDRGPDSLKVYKFIKSIPKSRRVLIRGNHEDLVLSAVKKPIPQCYDYSNGTVKTILHLAGESDETIEFFRDYLFFYSIVTPLSEVEDVWTKAIKSKKVKEVITWLNSDEWLNFFELDNFIFTHSFIPVRLKHNIRLSEYNKSYNLYLEYYPEWRDNTLSSDWYESRWRNPVLLYEQGFFKEEEQQGKTLVVGHWHTDDFHKILGKEDEDKEYNSSMYLSKGIIALDGGVRYVEGKLHHDCNVLVIEDNNIYDKHGNLIII